ncbi:hypothetical protein PO909_007577 [Leuciscus waleckii]
MLSDGFSEEDFTCPICMDFFVNPVVLPCSHSICSECIQTFWESRGFNECPICRKISPMDDPPMNLALRNLCESFQQERRKRSSSEGETVCSVHKEKLKLFCLDDQQPVCVVCRDSKTHTDHRFCPIEEAVNINKEKLRDSLQLLKEKLGAFENFQLTLDQTADLIKNETQDTEEKINKEFEELHEILSNEEAARKTALREEEEKKCQMIMEKTETTRKQIVSLTWKIRDIEEQMMAKDDSFLKNFKTTLQRAKIPTDPGNISKLLIDGRKYLSDLKRNVLQKIEGSSGDHSFRGGYNQRGAQSSRGGPQFQGGPEIQEDGHSFGGSYRSRGGYNQRGAQSFRGGPQFQGGPEIQGDGQSFGGSYRSRGGLQFQGGSEIQKDF